MTENPSIERPNYLIRLIRKKENRLVKVITGMRQTGKTYLLFTLYHNYLLSVGVAESHIIEISLASNSNLRDSQKLKEHILSKISTRKMYYVFIDDIQKISLNPRYYLPILLDLMKIPNIDIYVTGSNSEMFSSESVPEFQNKMDEIRVYPLSYREFKSAYYGKSKDVWSEYCMYGGLPAILIKDTPELKAQYLLSLCEIIYQNDIASRHTICYEKDTLDVILNIIASSLGFLTSPSTISNELQMVHKRLLSNNTVTTYLEYIADTYLLSKSTRYDVKGKKSLSSPIKYYFTDIGLCNARLNFHRQEENLVMENIIYNELLVRGFKVDVGILEVYGKENSKTVRKRHVIDFVANKGDNRYYIQSASSIENAEEIRKETMSLRSIPDSFKKIVVVRNPILPRHDENGILFVGVEQFLLEELDNYGE